MGAEMECLWTTLDPADTKSEGAACRSFSRVLQTIRRSPLYAPWASPSRSIPGSETRCAIGAESLLDEDRLKREGIFRPALIREKWGANILPMKQSGNRGSGIF